LNKTFKPSFGLKNPHVQTLYSSIFTRCPWGKKLPKIDFYIEKFIFSDGDFTECFWYSKPDKENKRPIVILFHGLTGSYKSPYIQGVMTTLEKNSFRTVLMHFRGCSGKMNTLARSYHSGETEDAKEFINHLNKEYSHVKLFAVGYSIGGNMLLKLLGEVKESSKISGAVSVSAPMQLNICADKINSGLSKFYQYILMKNLKLSLEEKYSYHDMTSIINIDKNEVKKLKTFWEFDDIYTAPVHGFTSVNDYYEKSSSKQFLKDITTNTLVIHSIDDPFMTPEILPLQDEISSKVKLEIYQYGGHVGFISGTILSPHYWLEDRIADYFISLTHIT